MVIIESLLSYAEISENYPSFGSSTMACDSRRVWLRNASSQTEGTEKKGVGYAELAFNGVGSGLKGTEHESRSGVEPRGGSTSP